ncbi:MAG: metallophosphoesterase [Bacteroidetes bacterium]|nr:MAG: metallophosphoesterase [Bacteroidota bacterium]
MKIILFSDVHANLPALEAFFADADAQNADAIYCLGDLVGYNIWPNEVVRAIKKRMIPTIAGNYDDGVGKHSGDCGCAYKTETDKDNGNISISYTNFLIGEEERAYLRTLPAHMRVEFKLKDTAMTLLLVHGSPRKINEYLFEDREEKSLLRMMQQASADIMCFGHTHKPYHRGLQGFDPHSSEMRYWHAINIGSVGKPKDGDARGCYAVLHLNEDANLISMGGIGVEFRRFTYDVERAAQAVENSPLPNAFADMLRKAY